MLPELIVTMSSPLQENFATPKVKHSEVSTCVTVAASNAP